MVIYVLELPMADIFEGLNNTSTITPLLVYHHSIHVIDYASEMWPLLMITREVMMEGMLYAPAVTNVVGLQWEVFESFIYPLAKSPRACDWHCITHLSIPPISDALFKWGDVNSIRKYLLLFWVVDRITNVYMSLVTGHVFPADNTRLINIS